MDDVQVAVLTAKLESCQRFREAARIRAEANCVEIQTLGAQLDWCLRRLPADVQADFDALAHKGDRSVWDM